MVLEVLEVVLKVLEVFLEVSYILPPEAYLSTYKPEDPNLGSLFLLSPNLGSRIVNSSPKPRSIVFCIQSTFTEIYLHRL
mgnify:CR=1 FL=1